MTDKRSQHLCLNIYRLSIDYAVCILWLIGTNGFIKNMLALFKRANEQCSCC